MTSRHRALWTIATWLGPSAVFAVSLPLALAMFRFAVMPIDGVTSAADTLRPTVRAAH